MYKDVDLCLLLKIVDLVKGLKNQDLVKDLKILEVNIGKKIVNQGISGASKFNQSKNGKMGSEFGKQAGKEY